MSDARGAVARGRRWVIAAAIAAGLLGSAACTSAGSTTDTKSIQASGSHPAINDVKVKTCANDPTLNMGQPVVTVTNHTSKMSNYLITVSVTSADGKTQVDTANTAVNNLEPSQTTDAQAVMAKSIPPGSVCKVSEVTRLAS